MMDYVNRQPDGKSSKPPRKDLTEVTLLHRRALVTESLPELNGSGCVCVCVRVCTCTPTCVSVVWVCDCVSACVSLCTHACEVCVCTCVCVWSVLLCMRLRTYVAASVCPHMCACVCAHMPRVSWPVAPVWSPLTRAQKYAVATCTVCSRAAGLRLLPPGFQRQSPAC